MIYKCSRYNIVAAYIVDDKVAYLVFDRTSWVEDLMSLCGVGDIWVAEQFLNNTSYEISMFFDKVRITCILDYDSFVFISIIRNADLLPLRTSIRRMFRLSTLITLADPGLSVGIFFSLRLRWLLLFVPTHGLWPSVELAVGQPHGTQLNSFTT